MKQLSGLWGACEYEARAKYDVQNMHNAWYIVQLEKH